jgi:hypothetical protein
MTPGRPRSRPAGERATSPPAEAWLRALGADPAFAEAVLGDLAEEFAERAGRDGAAAARWWYLREALRSAPHLVRSWLRRASPRARARVAACVTLAVVVPAAAVLALLSTIAGPPARLEIAAGDATEGVVVNEVRPIRLPVRVLDAAGRLLGSEGVRYRWASGDPAVVSTDGVLACARRADFTVRAALGPLATDVRVRCRPVREVRANAWNEFVLGQDSARELPVDFVGVDGRSVTLIAGSVRVRDSTVATLDGLRILPLAPGRTFVRVAVGNREGGGMVTVFEPVPALDRLRPGQRYVAAPVRLAPGDSIRWPLPEGLFYLLLRPDGRGAAEPLLRVGGAVMCIPEPAPGVYRTHCLVRAGGAHLTVTHPGTGAAHAVGTVLVEPEFGR